MNPRQRARLVTLLNRYIRNERYITSYSTSPADRTILEEGIFITDETAVSLLEDYVKSESKKIAKAQQLLKNIRGE